MRRIILGLCLLLVAGIVIVLVAGGETGPGEGPLEGGVFLDGQPLPVGVDYDMGSIGLFLTNAGEDPITIERTRLLRVAGPLEFVGVRSRYVVSGPSPSGSLWTGGVVGSTESADYPTVPLEDQNRIPVPKEFGGNEEPDEGLQLFFRLRMTEPGIGRAQGLEIQYRAANKRYREVVDWSFFMCAPEEEYIRYGSPDNKKCEGVPFGDDNSTLG